jgi:hypothetical protein
MKLEKLENPEKYIGLYIVDFGDYTSTGFTAEEVEMLLESEKYASIKVYKIYNAYPDGKLELRGVPNELFNLESGMFFYSDNEFTAHSDYKRLLNLAVTSAAFPTRAKLNLSRLGEKSFVVAMIYPAEADDQISAWLLDKDYRSSGSASGGIAEVTAYYDASPDIIERHQLTSSSNSKSVQQLYASLKYAVQR